MDHNLVQDIRYKLQKRVRKLNAAGYQSFHFSLVRFWGFLHSNELLKGILERLEKESSVCVEDGAKVVSGIVLYGVTEEEEVRLAYQVLKTCQAHPKPNIEYSIAHNYANEQQHDAALAHFKDIFVEPFYEYLDEQLDDERAILAVLRRFKHKCEWFQRERLLEAFQADTQIGEKTLALSLYEYLHDQGLSFSIEPSSVSGRADLISAQNSSDPLIADVKIFEPNKSKNKSYLVAGFQQVYQYTIDYNEAFGYLVVFNASEHSLGIAASNQEQSTSFICHNGKTIFFVIIDIYPHEHSASKRGKLKSYIITENEFVENKAESEEPIEGTEVAS